MKHRKVKCGLIGPLATFARVNKFGFIETPYRIVKSSKLTDEIIVLTADEEDNLYSIMGCSIKDGKFKNQLVIARYNREFMLVPQRKFSTLVSPKQLVGISCGLIPFLEHDDANRALMGANMQRQAVPLLKTEQAYIGTGLENAVARDSSSVILQSLVLLKVLQVTRLL